MPRYFANEFDQRVQMLIAVHKFEAQQHTELVSRTRVYVMNALMREGCNCLQQKDRHLPDFADLEHRHEVL